MLSSSLSAVSPHPCKSGAGGSRISFAQRRRLLNAYRPSSRALALAIQAALLVSVVLFGLWMSDAEGSHGLQLPAASRRLESLKIPNAFTDEQMKQGAVILHILCLLYMFVGIAIICDDYFVPALEVLVERWQLSEDVAGATFMAAGGSAPEFATSLLGVFVFESDVGFGTIIGSAVFNILFVIGLCAYFSGFKELQLTWFPLVRDSSFYILSLGVLMAVIYDREVAWYDAVIMTLLYVVYVLLMVKNEKIKERVVDFESKHLRISTSGKELEQRRKTAAGEAVSAATEAARAAQPSPRSSSSTAKIAPIGDAATDEEEDVAKQTTVQTYMSDESEMLVDESLEDIAEPAKPRPCRPQRAMTRTRTRTSLRRSCPRCPTARSSVSSSCCSRRCCTPSRLR